MGTGIVTDYFLNKIKEGATDIMISYIESLPILVGVSIPVYAILSMISKRIANLGVIGVFVYGGIVIIS